MKGNKLNVSFRNKQAGLTMIELIAGMAILAIVLGFVVQRVNQGFSTQSEGQVQTEIIALSGAAKNWRGTRPEYTGIACNDLVSDEYIEVPWTNCTGVNPEGGNYTVSANGTNSNNLDITATGLGNQFCNRVANAMEPNVESASCASGTLTVTFRG